MTSLRRALCGAALTLFLAPVALAQGSYPLASPVAVNRWGQPVKATVAICTSNPGTASTGCPTALVPTYTDITLTTACTGSPGTQFLNNQSAPTVGSGCSNPGTTDSAGNVLAFAASGSYWCQYYSPRIDTYVVPCQFGGSGGSANIGTLTPGQVPVACPAGSPVPLCNSSLVENGAIVRTPEPIQAPIVTATTPNTGQDFTGGNCSSLTFSAQHSYLCSDSAYNYGLHYWVNGLDTQATLLPNPVGTVYHVDGFVYTSLCSLVSNLPLGTVATIYEDILETNINCDPFNSGNILHVILAPHSSPYTWAVPMRIGPNEGLYGTGRGLSGTNTRGVTISPGTSYVSPYVSTTPSGFTLGNTTTGCTNGFPSAGTYLMEVSWGPDTTRETLPAQETSVTLDGATQCFHVTPPGSPPANVAYYDIYITAASGTTGQEHWQAQSGIASSATVSWSGSSYPAGSGKPPHINNTGAFVVVGNANGPQGNLNSTQATFGARLQDLSINCISAGCVPAALLTGEEGSGIFRVDVINIGSTATPGVAGIIWEGYGNVGLGASNSRIQDITINAAQSGGGDATTASLYIDDMTRGRGVDGFTITPTSSTTPVCVLFNNPDGSAGGMTIANGHMEKCADGFKSIGAATLSYNLSCSPSNVTNCVHWDSTTAPSATFNISGGVTSLLDDSSGFTSTQGVIGAYTNFQIGYQGITAGPAPTCTALPVNPGPNLTGVSGTCVMQTGSNNNAGVMNLTAAGGSELAAGTVELIYGGVGLGVNGSTCHFYPLSGGTSWPDNTSSRVTSIGTGNAQVRFIPGGGTGTAFVNGNTFSIGYRCDGF